MRDYSEAAMTDVRSDSAREPIIRAVAWLIICGTLVFGALSWFDMDHRAILFAYPSLLVVGISTLFLLRVNIRMAGMLITIGLISVIIGSSWYHLSSGPISIATGIMVAILISGLCWNFQSAYLVAAIGSFLFGNLVYGEAGEFGAPQLQLWAKISMIMLVMAGVVHWTLQALFSATREALLQQRRIADLFESSPDGMLILRADTRISAMNRVASELVGFAQRDVLGHRLDSLNWLDQDSTGQLETWVRTGNHRSLFEAQSADGDRVLELRVSELPSASDERDHLLTIRDVTERRQAERLTQTYEARLSESKSIEALGRLATGVAHDFNNLLTIILATLESIRGRGSHDTRVENDLGNIEEASHRGAELAGQLLAFASKQVMRPEVICPNTVVEKLLPLMRRVLPADIELVHHCDRKLGSVCVDAARLEQVLMNLVTNARDALASGGEIRIETHHTVFEEARVHDPADECGKLPGVCLSVRDNGEGIPAEVQKQMFQPFFSTKSRGQGSGLGLATVDGIVRQSGGYIEVESAPGRGARFSVYLPLCEARESASVPLPAPPPVRVTRPLRILLVEDETQVRMSIGRLLELMGHEVSEAENGAVALGKYADRIFDFDVLVTDISMPAVGGTELANRLAERNPDLRVLFLSGFVADQALHTLGGGSGPAPFRLAFLGKPFSRDALQRAIHDLIADAAA